MPDLWSMDYGIIVIPGSRAVDIYCINCEQWISKNTNSDAIGFAIEEHENTPHE